MNFSSSSFTLRIKCEQLALEMKRIRKIQIKDGLSVVCNFSHLFRHKVCALNKQKRAANNSATLVSNFQITLYDNDNDRSGASEREFLTGKA